MAECSDVGKLIFASSVTRTLWFDFAPVSACLPDGDLDDNSIAEAVAKWAHEDHFEKRYGWVAFGINPSWYALVCNHHHAARGEELRAISMTLLLLGYQPLAIGYAGDDECPDYTYAYIFRKLKKGAGGHGV